jgi:hypothetical protein
MSAAMEMLVFQDAAGDYYVLPRQAWEQARVPRNRRAEVEKLLGKGRPVQAVSARKTVPLRDLGAKGLRPEDAKRVAAGAPSVQPVGSFTAPSSLNVAIGASTWGSK